MFKIKKWLYALFKQKLSLQLKFCIYLLCHIFKYVSGNSYYVFNGNHLIENSPRTIMDYGFPPLINKVDAVMVYGEPPLTYLFR